LKQLVDGIKKRVRNLDYVKFMSRDLIDKLSEHYFNVRNYNKSAKLQEADTKFKLNGFEAGQERECEYLRNVIEIFIVNAFGEKVYLRNGAIRSLVREILVNKVVYPSIELIADPDYLNRKVLDYLRSREKLRSTLSTLFTEASTYEELVKVIKVSKNVDELKQVHYKIMNEIMQSTIISNFKDLKLAETSGVASSPAAASSSAPSKPLSSAIISGGSASFYAFFSDIKSIDHFDPNANVNSNVQRAQPNVDKVSKTELLRSGDLKSYIKRLRHAKMLCEMRLKNQNLNDEESNELKFENKLKNLKVLPFQSAIHLAKVQTSFIKFLENDGSDALLRFWIDVEKFRKLSNIKRKYELAKKIHENYLKNYDSPVRDEIGKDLHKSMQLFLLGDSVSFFRLFFFS
jgi:hypothetical protein